MKDKTLIEFKRFINNINERYLDEIRGDNIKSFTRNRKIKGIIPLILQMFSNKGLSQRSELINFYKNYDKQLDVSTVAFYNARMKFNPEAIRHMLIDFIYAHYNNPKNKMVKLNGYYITAVDGSDIIIPSTLENEKIYGKAANGNDNNPVMGKLSTIYDCINKFILDVQIEKYKFSEIELANRHLDVLYNNMTNKIITIFDRGYFSMKLAIKMNDNNQKFLFRLKSHDLKKYCEGLNINEDKIIELKYDMRTTNQYREDKEFRERLLNNTFKFRIVKILINDNGKNTEEVLFTNIPQDEFDIDGMKELYHLRWNIETAYNVLKNKMKLEEFSGYRNNLIRQDIYSTSWLYNLVQMYIIETNEKYEIPSDRYKYKMCRNTNQSIGIIKSYFIRSVILYDSPSSDKDISIVDELAKIDLVPKRDNRHYDRKSRGNKSRISYRYTY